MTFEQYVLCLCAVYKVLDLCTSNVCTYLLVSMYYLNTFLKLLKTKST